ncbi:MAG: S8 family serine peptidase [Ardenticatenaceae bacterium]|nr:S8 family serine peptidase [Ardenticatenaceae bacterium]
MLTETFYYTEFGDRVDLTPSSDAVAIKYQAEVPPKDLEKLIRGDDRLAEFVVSSELRQRGMLVYKRSTAARTTLSEFIARLSESDQIAYAMPVYFLNQHPVLITDEFVVGFKPDVPQSEIDALNQARGIEILEAFDFSPNTFLLRVPRDNQAEILDIVRAYYALETVKFSEPNLIYIKELKFAFNPNDALFSQQWHLPMVDAPEAWDITRGDRSVVIAIIDDGVDLDHEDFASPGKIVPTADLFDFISSDNDPRPALSNDDHGTAVAGVATADGNNSIGVTGVAPNCRLMAIRLDGTNSATRDANAFRFAANHGASVINNSWGPPDGAGAFPLPALVRAAINHATDNGRGGLGCVIFFAAGNGNEHISAPATLDGYASYNRVIAVAASNDTEVRSAYSDFGPEVNICAPSNDTAPGHRGIVTTDRMGSQGYNPPSSGSDPISNSNYTGTFGGTSSSSPLAAGISALMLATNPDLTWEQVRYILEATAEKIDSANTNPVAQYQPNGHSQWYGYGRVNAFEAVKGARSSVPDRDFVHRITVTLRRTSGDRFVSTKIVRPIDARQRRAETGTEAFVRSGPDGFLRTEMSIGSLELLDEVEVDS